MYINMVKTTLNTGVSGAFPDRGHLQFAICDELTRWCFHVMDSLWPVYIVAVILPRYAVYAKCCDAVFAASVRGRA